VSPSVSVVSGSSLAESKPVRARALAKVYDLLLRRARGDGIVAFRGVIPVEGPNGLVGVADVQVGDERGLIAVREVEEVEDE
jgi:hypothetical protein